MRMHVIPHKIHKIDDLAYKSTLELRGIVKYEVRGVYEINSFFHKRSDRVIKAQIDSAVASYADVTVRVTDLAYLWVATKPGAGSIYIFNTSHRLDKTEDANAFIEAGKVTSEKVDVVMTEAEITFMDYIKLLYFSSDYRLPDIEIAASASTPKKYVALEDKRVIEKCGYDFDKVSLSRKSTAQDILGMSKDYLSPNFFQLTHEYFVAANQALSEVTRRRNLYWMQSILQSSNSQQSSIVLCGAGHSVGKYGIPNLLAHYGYQLKPLMQRIPPSKTTLCRELFSGKNHSRFFGPIPKLPIIITLPEENKKEARI